MKKFCIFLALTLPLAAQDAAQTSSRLQESLNRRALQEQMNDRRTAPALPEGFKTEEDKADEAAPSAEERQPILPLKKHTYNQRDNKPHWLFAVTAEF